MWHRDITGEMFTVRLLCIVVLSELTIVFCVLTNNKCPLALLNLLNFLDFGDPPPPSKLTKTIYWSFTANF